MTARQQTMPVDQATLTVLSWNICQGGGNRIVRIADAAVSVGADVVVLSEVTARNYRELADALAARGFTEQTHRTHLVTKVNPYAMLLASRLPIVSADQPGTASCPGRFVRAEVLASIDTFDVLGIHVPTTDPVASEFFEEVCQMLDLLAKRPALLCGDVNADANHPGLLTRFLPRIAAAGWVDALVDRDPVASHLTYWGRTTAYAIDRVWITPPLRARLRECRVLEEIDGQPVAGNRLRIGAGALSDHRPLLTTLGCNAPFQLRSTSRSVSPTQ